MDRSRLVRFSFLAVVTTLAILCATAAEPIRWFNGQWDDTEHYGDPMVTTAFPTRRSRPFSLSQPKGHRFRTSAMSRTSRSTTRYTRTSALATASSAGTAGVAASSRRRLNEQGT